MILSPDFENFILFMYWLPEILKAVLCWSLEFSLWAGILLPGILFWELCFHFPDLLAAWFRESFGLCLPDYSLPALCLGSLSRRLAGAIVGLTSFGFPSLGDYYLSVPDFQCLESQCPVYFVLLAGVTVVSDRRVIWCLSLPPSQNQKSAFCFWS